MEKEGHTDTSDPPLIVFRDKVKGKLKAYDVIACGFGAFLHLFGSLLTIFEIQHTVLAC